MTNRERLVEELAKHLGYNIYSQNEIVDFILERDKKIVEPLVQWRKRGGDGEELTEAIDATLQNAGI